MNSNIYQPVPLKPTSALQRLFKQMETDNAIIELNNLLANNSILGIKLEQVSGIARKYKVNLLKEFERNIDEFYGAYLNHCLKDKVLSDNEIEELKHLKAILGLNDSRVDMIHGKLTGVLYRQSIEEIVSDGRISKSESDFLSKLQDELRLPDEIANKISSEIRVGYFNKFMDEITSDGILSPEESKEMDAIAKSLRIDVQVDKKNKAALERMKELWRIENTEPHSIDVDLKLPKGEICYYTAETSWHEFKSSRGFGSSTFNTKVVKGYTYKVGAAITKRNEADLKYADSGMLYITNKRISFVGKLGNKNVPFGKILGFSPFQNGIEIEKDAGKDIFLKMNGDLDLICTIFSKALKET